MIISGASHSFLKKNKIKLQSLKLAETTYQKQAANIILNENFGASHIEAKKKRERERKFQIKTRINIFGITAIIQYYFSSFNSCNKMRRKLSVNIQVSPKIIFSSLI